MAKHMTMRGRQIDFNALIEQNATKVALGNARMNAKGDILGKGGVILKTQEQVEAEWDANRTKIQDSIPTDIKSTLVSKPAAIIVDDQKFEPTPVPTETPRKRKIIESES